MLSVSGNCQWYNRRYGVNDINQLSYWQLNKALSKTNEWIKIGAGISIASAVGIISGIIMMNSANEFEEVEKYVYGIMLIGISVPMEIAGMTAFGISTKRAKSIKEVLKSTELKMGLVNYQCGNICSGSQGSLLPCLSVTIRF